MRAGRHSDWGVGQPAFACLRSLSCRALQKIAVAISEVRLPASKQFKFSPERFSTAMRHWQKVLFGVPIAFLASGIFAMASAQLAPIRAGYGGTGGYQLPLWVNREAGLAKKYGIDLEVLLIGAGSLNMQALVGGSIQLSQNSVSAAIQAALKGVPVVII